MRNEWEKQRVQFSSGLVGNNAYAMGGVNFVIIVAKFTADLVTSGGMHGVKLWGGQLSALSHVFRSIKHFSLEILCRSQNFQLVWYNFLSCAKGSLRVSLIWSARVARPVGQAMASLSPLPWYTLSCFIS
jgi:hypothetical protein